MRKYAALWALVAFHIVLPAQAPELVIPTGHTNAVTAVACSPTRDEIVTGSRDGTAKLWNADGRELRTLAGHRDRVIDVAFSPDGDFILTGSRDSTALLWDRHTGRVVRPLRSPGGGFYAVAFSPDGQYIATGRQYGWVELWDRGGQRLWGIKGHNAWVGSIAFSSDGKMLLSGSGDGRAKLWRVDGTQIDTFGKGHGDITAVAFAPDDASVAVAATDGTALHLTLDGDTLGRIENKTNLHDIAFASDGNSIWTANDDGTVKSWNPDGTPRATIAAHDQAVLALAFDRHGQAFVTGSADFTARRRDLSGRLQQTYRGYAQAVIAAAFSRDGQRAMTGYRADAARFWQLDATVVLPFYRRIGMLKAVAFHPERPVLVTGQNAGALRRWEIGSAAPQQWQGHTSGGHINSIALSPDGQLALTGGDDGLAILWNTITGQRLLPLLRQDSPVTAVAIDAVNRVYLTGSTSGVGRLWNAAGVLLDTFRHADWIRAAAFSPDGRYLLTGSDDRTAVLRDRGGQKITVFRSAGPVRAVAFAPDGQSVFAAGADKTAQRWDLAGNPLQTFSGHAGPVNAVACSPDGAWLLTGSSDHTAKIWDAGSGRLRATLIALDSSDWVVTSPSGLFDASAGAMERLYFVVGDEIVELEQLKERYFEPGLLDKIVHGSEAGLRTVDKLEALALPPRIGVTLDGDRLLVELAPRNGGIGPVALLLDGRIELEPDVNPGRATRFTVDLGAYDRHFFHHRDSINRISLRAYNRYGWLKGPPLRLDYRPTDATAENPRANWDRQLDSIRFFAVIVGTSTYRGHHLNLTYPADDAAAFAAALRTAGSPLFGRRLDVTLLTTAGSVEPRKKAIAAALARVAAEAGPRDILLVYLSGHGLVYPANSEQGQFFYLTTELFSDKLDDPAVRQEQAIAQDTLQAWLRAVKARKRILILDACNSGSLVEAWAPGRKALNSDQRRALERMKDRSGMFVLAGSAADKASYEASRYGHGLLTYSLLTNMPRVAAAKAGPVDVATLFGLVREDVPRLALELQRRQEPQLIGAESYDIGLIRDPGRCPVPAARPVVVRAVFVERGRSKDLARLSAAVNTQFERRAQDREAPFTFWPVDELTGDYYYVGGDYETANQMVTGRARVYRRDQLVKEFPFSQPVGEIERAAATIAVEVLRHLRGH
jgi:WD40 repeat protein